MAEALQRHRKRIFAVLGVACSVLVLAVIHSEVGLDRMAYGIPELIDSPRAHSGSPPRSQ
jgi:hypothetical protein